jgi:predicted nucleic acid-binding protein
VRFLVDTNVFTYAANRDCDEHRVAVEMLTAWLSGSVPWAVTPLTARRALGFLEPILANELVTILIPTPRHEALLVSTIHELGQPARERVPRRAHRGADARARRAGDQDRGH